jgi:uncharacterized protein YcfJ
MTRIKTSIMNMTALSVSAAIALAGCVQQPMGPRVAVMPPPNKPFEVFQQDQAVCTQWANQQTAGEAEDANSRAVGTAVIGTILGAGLGAAIGGGGGAAIGAASGAIGGTAIAAGPAGGAQYDIQQRYDIAYSQCMYSKGNQVPGYSYNNAPPPPPPPAG